MKKPVLKNPDDENSEKVFRFDENDWSDPDFGTAYSKAKTKAELLAYEIAKEKKLNITTILPALMLGPIITSNVTPTSDFIKKVFQLPFYLDTSIGMVHV